MNTAIITPVIADGYLAQYADWIALVDVTKELHISRACVYVQTMWTCVDVDWDDIETVPDAINEAIANYAYADYKENLFGDLSDKSLPRGQLRGEKSKVGDLEDEVTYYKGGAVTPSGNMKALGYPNALMSSACTLKSGCTTDVVRV